MNTSNRRILVFAPHPDDETLACGGTIILETRQGSHVFLVFMTDGRNSHTTTPNTFPKPTREGIKTIRKVEALKTAEILGVQKGDIFFLDYIDGTLQDNIQPAAAAVQRHLNSIYPTDVYAPAFADIHRDHHSTNSIVLAAISNLKLRLNLFEYVIWAGDEKLKTMKRLPNLVTADISAALPKKLEAINSYASQVANSLNGYPQTPVLNDNFLSRFKLPVEHFWKYQIQNGKPCR